LKVLYESKMTWKPTTDYLRCNPSFHNHPRYDHVMMETLQDDGETSGYFFGQLCFMFKCMIEGKEYSMAFIHPYDTPTGRVNQQQDRDLGFWKLWEKPRASAEFISVDSIICGLPVAPDFGNDGQHLFMNTVDSNLWLRLKEMKELARVR
ncbi:hypothetical protein BDZ94DRAFT_1161358, partial [Collybia nuda]